MRPMRCVRCIFLGPSKQAQLFSRFCKVPFVWRINRLEHDPEDCKIIHGIRNLGSISVLLLNYLYLHMFALVIATSKHSGGSHSA